MMPFRQYPSDHENDHEDNQPASQHQQNDDYTNFNEGYRELHEVRNSLPPPRNPYRDSGEEEDD
ncbi:MAG: hypothetical protein LWW81_07210 [Rhodocyclales bacterium]|nr:hypothetical protein [Rhodocyclales bacterium]